MASGTRADTTGYLTPPHSDLGLDTNGDRSYNYLQMDIRFYVTSPGHVMSVVELRDPLNLPNAILTTAQASGTFDPGPATLRVLLSGPDIYNGGVDGPYYAHIILRSVYGTVLDEDLHPTAPYLFSQFQPFPIRFIPPASERTLDNDTDGLREWITLGLSLDVATEGDYTVAGLLVDSAYTIGLRWRTSAHLLPGRTSVTQYFRGYPLKLAGVSGPFLLTNEVLDGQGVPVDGAFYFHETAAYAASSFEDPPAVLAPPHSETPVDTDGDGLIDLVSLAVRLHVQETAVVLLTGELRSGDGATLIESVQVRPTLAPGSLPVAVGFSGAVISASRINGPYQVRLRVEDTESRALSAGTHSTAAYQYAQFEAQSLQLVAPHEDAGVDMDGDGSYERLRFDVYVDVGLPGSYAFDATLLDGTMTQTIASATREVSLGAGVSAVPLYFPGEVIRASGIDGPYRLTVQVRDPFRGEVLDTGGHRSKFYAVDWFEAGPGGIVAGIASEDGVDTDPVPDGLLNILRVAVRVTLDQEGRYRLEGTLASGGVPVASAATTARLSAGASDMTLAFSGWEISASGLDGPYDLWATLSRISSGSTVVDETSVRTASYARSAFAVPVPAVIVGRVVSGYGLGPMAGAEVWALSYANAFSRRALTNATGWYTLSLNAGAYLLVADRGEAQAVVRSITAWGSQWSNFSLYAQRVNGMYTTLTWQGWRVLTLSTRQLLAADGLALRARLDWDEGDRDGLVSPAEEALLAPPPSLSEDAMDAGDTGVLLAVNGAAYRASGPVVRADSLVGDALATGLPSIERSRSFVSSFSPGSPPKVGLSLRSPYDAVDWDYRFTMIVPGGYRYIGHSPDDSVVMFARWNPFLLDVEGDPLGGTEPSFVDVGVLLYRETSYAPSTPLPPIGLSAAAEGSSVALAWTGPTVNADGTRIVNLAGYHVYRASASGSGFSRVSLALVLSPSFTDPGPGPGLNYYVVTAVNSDGMESAASLEAAAQVPLAVSRIPMEGTMPHSESQFGNPWTVAAVLVLLGLHRLRRRRDQRLRPALPASLGEATPPVVDSCSQE